MDWPHLRLLWVLCSLYSLIARCRCFPLSVEELEDEVTTAGAGEADDSGERKYTTNSWSFDDYTSVTPPAATRNAADVAAAGIEDELHALRKVAEILLLLGEQVIPIIIGDPVNDRCYKNKNDFRRHGVKVATKLS
ncbi:PREDICTED: uncharacterized protein LOC106120391 [Papilio xuthus]|uniref:Uncharacterized protein LOC106120391 n=1 Tax=Papilio xuthus TaxID=66420 RepID=A0AAJ6ZF15_PAPXU|nr:PREDICTED: uncharacterized protein LOC106120391 [Papilio xuthus]